MPDKLDCKMIGEVRVEKLDKGGRRLTCPNGYVVTETREQMDTQLAAFDAEIIAATERRDAFKKEIE